MEKCNPYEHVQNTSLETSLPATKGENESVDLVCSALNLSRNVVSSVGKKILRKKMAKIVVVVCMYCNLPAASNLVSILANGLWYNYFEQVSQIDATTIVFNTTLGRK